MFSHIVQIIFDKSHIHDAADDIAAATANDDRILLLSSS